MSDETAFLAESTARLIATTVRVSQILGVTLEDATSLVSKWTRAIEAAEATRKSAS